MDHKETQKCLRILELRSIFTNIEWCLYVRMYLNHTKTTGLIYFKFGVWLRQINMWKKTFHI